MSQKEQGQQVRLTPELEETGKVKTNNESSSIVSVKGLSFRYFGSERNVLDQLDLDIKPGEIILIAGHSGSGKSTLLRAINGLIPHQHAGIYAGRVCVDGLEVSSTTMSKLATKVGYIFQNPENQIFMFSVERDIAFGLENLNCERSEIRRRVDWALKTLGIKDLALRAPHELSDGQKQRVAIAGVIVMEPRILILDEPTSLLDPFTARELVALVKKLHDELGITVLIVEHRLDLVAKIATRLIVLDRGKVAYDGSPGQVLYDADVSLFGVTEPTVVRLFKLISKENSFGQASLDLQRPIDAEDLSSMPISSLAFRGKRASETTPLERKDSETLTRFGGLPSSTLPSFQTSSLNAETRDVSSGETIVRFAKVDYSHPNGVAALNKVTLEVRRGELLAILGTNGAGKSTLVRHINGLLKPTHGSVEVFGVNTKETTPAKLSRRVGIVFQNANDQLFAESVRKEIEFGLRNFGFSEDFVKQRTDWALHTFSLEEYENRPPMELSGGEKKRLCSALVLAWDPDILVLDEPTVGQDSEQKERLVQMIEMLQTQRKTVILVTHDVEFVWPLQPRVVLMTEGRIVADGRAQSVFGSSAQDVVSECNVLPPQLVELFKRLGRKDDFPNDVYSAREKLSGLTSDRKAKVRAQAVEESTSLSSRKKIGGC